MHSGLSHLGSSSWVGKAALKPVRAGAGSVLHARRQHEMCWWCFVPVGVAAASIGPTAPPCLAVDVCEWPVPLALTTHHKLLNPAGLSCL